MCASVVLSYAAALLGKTWGSADSVLASGSEWLCEPPQPWMHRRSEVRLWDGGSTLSWSVRARQATCAEVEWQCSHLSERMVDVKPRGSGDSLCVWKPLKQGERAYEPVGDVRKRCISHYTNTCACEVVLSDCLLIYLFLSYWTCWWQALVLVPLITNVDD